jgi:hypothetical protein
MKKEKERGMKANKSKIQVYGTLSNINISPFL